MPAHKHSDSEIERAYQYRVVKGKTLQETAKIIGVSIKTIERWAIAYGWKQADSDSPLIEKAHRLYVVENKPVKEVAEAAKVSVAMVNRWIKQFNWKAKEDFRYSYEIGQITFAGFREFLKANHRELSAQIDDSIDLYINIQKRYEAQVQQNLKSASNEHDNETTNS